MGLRESLSTEKHYSELSKRHRLALLVLVSVGSSAIYTPIYLKTVFYDPLMQALDCTNEQLGTLVTVYAVAATIFYFFSGVVADKVSVRTLSWVGYLGTALLTLIYSFLPTYNVLLAVFFCYAIFSILIWWGTRFKLVRLICSEEEYSKKIGYSYGIFGAAGLVLGVIAIPIVSMFASAALGIQTLLLVNTAIQLALAVIAFLIIPRFKGELGDGMSETFSFKGIGTALKNPGVWWASLAMFFCVLRLSGLHLHHAVHDHVLGSTRASCNCNIDHPYHGYDHDFRPLVRVDRRQDEITLEGHHRWRNSDCGVLARPDILAA